MQALFWVVTHQLKTSYFKRKAKSKHWPLAVCGTGSGGSPALILVIDCRDLALPSSLGASVSHL